jgi:multiple sugar transport system ATP-binding protein
MAAILETQSAVVIQQIRSVRTFTSPGETEAGRVAFAHDDQFEYLATPVGLLRSRRFADPAEPAEVIAFDGRRVNEVEPSRRGVALAFETYALYPPLTVRENIGFCLRAKGVTESEVKQRVEEVARVVDVSAFLDSKPGELGSGEKQRVALARALVRRPSVFLMDEPLSHLDAAHRHQMRVELKRLHVELGTTTVLVTHDQLEAIAMADRIAVMYLGVLQQIGTADEIYNNPANIFVADFVGEPAINFLPCRLTSRDGEPWLVGSNGGAFEWPVPEGLRAKVAKAKARELKLGVRPMDISLSLTPGEGYDIASKVYAFESLGEEGHLTVQVGEDLVAMVTSPLLDVSGDLTVWLRFQPDRTHLFDSETGMAV